MANGVGAALITGAGRRIGAAIAEAMAREGRPVAIHCHGSAEEAEATARRIAGRGGRAAVVAGDLADPATLERLVPQTAEALGGPLEVLVNNASIFEEDGIGALEVAAWDRQMAINLRAPVFLAQAFAAQLPANVGGCVVNVIDQRVLKATGRFVSYTLSKSALLTATETLALALAPRVRVVGVAPGPTLANARQSAEAFARQAEATPLGRGPTPAEIARAVLFLLEAESVTGVMLPVDGGQHLAPDRDDD
ncbi:NAD(P)-dependent dehydrogenase (short-subunit alcohol dehydrogenase family) [Methylopila capsulata]|uniref:NAD(P)-dependent dehydrogenase (Short-subunit alcohol dehydrogenase family) n=1 Tax=Methylopila capsulata TaxID=61654 RepID=A0A9W6ITJ9_9HYPH|nr:SDR family oxidoreductase [Methylopila capsulata]MBM7850665.1 NAD(P)-dependent dehydrogenase (short-subunit alcohol dehydrogenase family) [Methylopila capsulata]GLK55958.1 short chain dehydrogenase [Methylopila capsulata]